MCLTDKPHVQSKSDLSFGDLFDLDPEGPHTDSAAAPGLYPLGCSLLAPVALHSQCFTYKRLQNTHRAHMHVNQISPCSSAKLGEA